MCHAVLCQNGNIISGYKFRYAVVNFRIHMIRPSSEHNGRHIMFFYVFKRFHAFFMHIFPETVPFGKALFNGALNCFRINAEIAENFYKAFNKSVFVFEGYKRI